MSERKLISDVFVNTIEYWPRTVFRKKESQPLKEAILDLKPNEDEVEVNMKLDKNSYDLTKHSLHIEKEHRPEVVIRRFELHRESTKHNTAGGTLFRVLGDNKELEKSSKLCIQYLLIWTQQFLPKRIALLALLLFIQTFSFQLLFYFRYPISLVEIKLTHTFWSLMAYPFMILISVLIYDVGYYIKNKKIDINLSILLPISSVLLYGFAQEYRNVVIRGEDSFRGILPKATWISMFPLIVSIIVFVIFNTELGKKLFKEKLSHKMDYAPIFLYLKRNNDGKGWSREGVHYDQMHYKTNFEKGKTFKIRFIRPKEYLQFTIGNEWHSIENSKRVLDVDIASFELFRDVLKESNPYNPFIPAISIWINAMKFVQIWYIIYIFAIYVGFAILVFFFPTFDDKFAIFIIYVGIGTFQTVYSYDVLNVRMKYSIGIWEDLYNKSDEELLAYHHLSIEKLRVLWNLRDPKITKEIEKRLMKEKERLKKGEKIDIEEESSKEKLWIVDDHARFIIRVKIQYPFVNYKQWDSLRDTPEELLSIITFKDILLDNRKAKHSLNYDADLEELPIHEMIKQQVIEY